MTVSPTELINRFKYLESMGMKRNNVGMTSYMETADEHEEKVFISATDMATLSPSDWMELMKKIRSAHGCSGKRKIYDTRVKKLLSMGFTFVNNRMMRSSGCLEQTIDLELIRNLSNKVWDDTIKIFKSEIKEHEKGSAVASIRRSINERLTPKIGYHEAYEVARVLSEVAENYDTHSIMIDALIVTLVNSIEALVTEVNK